MSRITGLEFRRSGDKYWHRCKTLLYPELSEAGEQPPFQRFLARLSFGIWTASGYSICQKTSPADDSDPIYSRSVCKRRPSHCPKTRNPQRVAAVEDEEGSGP